MKLFNIAVICCALTMSACAKNNSKIVIETTMGEIQLELYDSKAPETVKNFLSYIEQGFYDGTIFHRVIPGFMIQGGGFTGELIQKKTGRPIKNEATNGISNQRGTLAMARTQAPHSATAQFFINTKDNTFLDHSSRDFGYCVFGKVTKGMDIVDAISAVSTHNEGYYQNVPDEPVIIIGITKI